MKKHSCKKGIGGAEVLQKTSWISGDGFGVGITSAVVAAEISKDGSCISNA